MNARGSLKITLVVAICLVLPATSLDSSISRVAPRIDYAMAYGNLALDLILRKLHGRLVVLKNGRYDNIPIDAVTASKKVVNVREHYNTDRLRPYYKSFEMKPLFIMTSEAV